MLVASAWDGRRVPRPTRALATEATTNGGASEARTDASGDGSQVTSLLARCSNGDREAFEDLIPLVYGDLKGIAHRRLQHERADHTLDTTAIVHEAYLRLVPQATATWQDRAHFFAVAARVIRHLLIDYARRRDADKRGGSAVRVPLREDLADGDRERGTVDLLALNETLDDLARKDERLARVVECRYFGGMTMEDTAEAVGVSKRTAERDWTMAKAFLYRALAT